MQIVQTMQFGGPEVLVMSEAPDPVAGPGQVIVDVSVAPVLTLDTQIRSGWGSEWFPVKPPYIPGAGVAGEVISVGEGVAPDWVGRRVVADTGEGGGYAERAVAPVEGLIPVSDGLGLPDAAALLHDGRTALGLFEEARVHPGERVLITAASGGLGSLLVQLAHAAGARIIGAARGKEKLELARELGAEVVVDYSEPGWPEQVREAIGGAGADVVFDGGGGDIGRAAFEITASGGRFSAHGAPSGAFAEIDPQEAERRGITISGIQDVQFAPAEANRLTERALSEAAVGRIRPVIGQTFPLEKAADAHAAIEAREVVGKTLLIVRPSAPFTRTELDYLAAQTLGRLATVQPDETLQISPVGFHYNAETATIDIGGYDMAASRKFRNVADNGRVAFVVDDIISSDPWRVRCLEIRGHAEAIDTPANAAVELDGEIIRVHPKRIISFGIDEPDLDPHQLTPNNHDVAKPPKHRGRN